jgi:dipeptidyl aminopeptidase/acylaminoacyl peptidase
MFMTSPLPWIFLFCLAGAPSMAQSDLRPASNLVAEGIPPIPLTLVEEVKRYTDARAATFAGWHPTEVEMLISTRFGNTAQIHRLSSPLGMRHQLTFFEEPVSSGGYEQISGRYFLFRRDQGGSEFAQIYRYDVATGAATLLTDGGRSQNGGETWSTKGDRIAYTSTRRTGADRDIYIMDPRRPAAERRLLELQGGGWGVADWSPDDRMLLVWEYISINESHLWTVDTTSGLKRELTPRSDKQVAYGAAAFSQDGRGVYLTTDRDFEFQRLAYTDLATNQTDYLTSDISHDVTSLSLSDDGRSLVFLTNEEGISRAYLLDIASREYQRIDGLPEGVMSGGVWHNNNRHVAFNVNNARSATDVFVLDVTSKTVTRWTESELGGIAKSDLREAQLIRWKSFDGLEITGFKHRPADRFTGKRPVIISIHGGPESQSLPLFQGRNNYYLNELGVAIIEPNVRGSRGFGKTFVALDNGPKREDSVKDIGALLDWIARQPDLHASRVMVTGGSYGGYMTLAAAVHYNDRIRCSVDVVGISNFITFLQNTESYRRDLRRAEYGDERDPEMRAIFEQISPLTHAAKIMKPIFVIQGANDPRVPRTEAVQIAETVRKNGTPVWYLEAKDEGHGFAKKGNRDFQFYATVMFVKKYLL